MSPVIDNVNRKLTSQSNEFYNEVFDGTCISFDDEKWFFENVNLPQNLKKSKFNPKLKINLNDDVVNNILSNFDEKVSLSISIENKNTKQWSLFKKFEDKINNFVDDTIIDLNLEYSEYLNFGIHLTINIDEPSDRFGLNYSTHGCKVADKSFEMRVKSSFDTIRFKWVDPNEFKREGVSETSFYYVKWKYIDLKKEWEPDDVEFWLNNDYHTKFDLLCNDQSQFSKYILADLKSDILFDLILPVINDEEFLPNINNKDTIAYQIWTNVFREIVDITTFNSILENNNVKYSKLRTLCRQFCETDSNLSLLSF